MKFNHMFIMSILHLISYFFLSIKKNSQILYIAFNLFLSYEKNLIIKNLIIKLC
jgi:hypothetical protein